MCSVSVTIRDRYLVEIVHASTRVRRLRCHVSVTMYAESRSQAPNTVVMLGPLVPLPLLEGTSPTSVRVREVPQQTQALVRLPLLEGASPTSERTERDSPVPPDTRATRH